MIKRIGVIAFILFVLALTPWGYRFIGNIVNPNGLASDMKSLFRAHGVEPKGIDCSMIDPSRTGSCDFEASAGDIRKIVREIGMTAMPAFADADASTDPEIEHYAHLMRSVWKNPVSKLAAGYQNGNRVSCYVANPKPGRSSSANPLRDPIKPASFSYLVVYYDPQTGKASAQAAYAY